MYFTVPNIYVYMYHGSNNIHMYLFMYAAESLGLPLIPAHSEASGDQTRYGVNYASAAAGILDDTGRNFVSNSYYNFIFLLHMHRLDEDAN